MGMMNRKSFVGWKRGDAVKPVLVTCEQHGVEGVCKCPVKQEYAKDADINHVMRNYPGNVVLPVVQPQGVFADVSGVVGFAETLRIGDQAREAFMGLAAKVRSRFDNDAYKFLEFLADEKNYDEAVSLGLVEKKEPVKAPLPDEKSAAPGEAKPESTPKA